MKNYLNNLQPYLLFLLFSTILLSPACKKDECKADFSTSFANGGMAPETVTVSADYGDQDSYDWNVDGVMDSGTPKDLSFASAGSFNVDLSVSNGDLSCSESSTIDIRDFPYQGFMTQSGEEVGRSISYFESNGTLNTMIFDIPGAKAVVIPAGDPINIDGTGGLDYDDVNRRLYVSPNFPTGGVTFGSCLPNGAELELVQGAEDFGITDLIVDDEKQMLYYSIRIGGNAVIRQVDLNTGDRLATFNNLGVFDIYFALNRTTNDLFWTSGSCIGKIDGMIMQGNEGFFCDQQNTGAIGSMIFDNTKNLLYFTQLDDETETYSIYRIDVNQAEPTRELLVGNASSVSIDGITMDEENQELFWSDAGDNTIKKLNLGTDEIEVIVENVSSPRGLAVGIFK